MDEDLSSQEYIARAQSGRLLFALLLRLGVLLLGASEQPLTIFLNMGFNSTSCCVVW